MRHSNSNCMRKLTFGASHISYQTYNSEIRKMKSYTLEYKVKVILYYRSLQSKVGIKDKSINEVGSFFN